jgi:hypothetical protein
VFRVLPATGSGGQVAGRKKVPRRSCRFGGGIFGSAAPTGVCGCADMCPWTVGAVRAGYILRKEVIQPQVPLRLPCYDLVPIKKSIVDVCEDGFGYPSLSWLDGRCVQGSGTHSPQCC